MTDEEGTFACEVVGIIPEIEQSSENTCWAAAATMLFSWMNQQSYSIHDVLNIAGPNFLEAFDEGRTLLPEEKSLFIDFLGFAQEPDNVIYPVEGLRSLLENWGALWFSYYFGWDRDKYYTHGWIITGLEGDYSLDNTTIYYIDPSAGAPDHISFQQFSEKIVAGSEVEKIPMIHAKELPQCLCPPCQCR